MSATHVLPYADDTFERWINRQATVCRLTDPSEETLREIRAEAVEWARHEQRHRGLSEPPRPIGEPTGESVREYLDALAGWLRSVGSEAASPEQVQANGDNGDGLRLDDRALALFFADTSLSKRAIAAKLGCHTKSLTRSRCPRLDAAMAAFRAREPSGTVRRGSKSANGDIEAWDE